jgi:hypothetical protein
MHITYEPAKDTFTAIEGATQHAVLDVATFIDDKNETFDEAMLRALRSLQLQLKNSGVSDPMIDNTVAAAVPMLAVLIRKNKKKTASYRAYNFPH